MKRLSILLLLLLAATAADAARRRSAIAPSGCTLLIQPRTIAMPATAHTATITVTSVGVCEWRATTAAGWLTLSRNANVVTVVATQNSGAARTAVIDIGGHVITVTQEQPVAIVPENLVTNGTFDANTNGWTNQHSTGSGSALWSPNNGGSAQLTLTQANAVYQLHTCITPKPNTRYDIGTQVFVPGGQAAAGFAMFGVFETTVPDCAAASYTASNIINFRTPTDRWEAINSSFTTSSQARSLFVVIGVATPSNPPFRAFFDNVYLRERR